MQKAVLVVIDYAKQITSIFVPRQHTCCGFFCLQTRTDQDFDVVVENIS